MHHEQTDVIIGRMSATHRPTIFYSWQSELPNKTNRGLIHAALEMAAKAIREDTTVESAPRIDHDTEGVPGAPDIAETICAKIERASAFVCDVSLINRGEGVRSTPNPNVLFELGFAVARLGWSRVVLVMNEAFGPVQELPFDLSKKRTLVYLSQPDDTQRAAARDVLRAPLERALRAVLAQGVTEDVTVIAPAPSPADIADAAVRSGSTDAVPAVKAYMADLAAQLDALAPPKNTPAHDGVADQRLLAALDASVSAVAEFGRVSRALAAGGNTKLALTVFRGFEAILAGYDWQPGRTTGSWFDTDFDFHRFVGHELFVMFVAALLGAEQLDVLSEVLDEELCTETNTGPTMRTFHELSRYLKLLEMRKERLKLNSGLLHADLLKQRHTEGEIATTSPFDGFMEADNFLFLRAELLPDASPLTAGDGQLWRPWSNVYFSRKIPTFLVRAQKEKYARPLAAALGVRDIPTLRARYKSRARNIERYFRDRTWFDAGLVDADALGSR